MQDLELLLGSDYRPFLGQLDGREYRGHVSAQSLPFRDAVSRVLKRHRALRGLGIAPFAGRVTNVLDPHSDGGLKLYAISDAYQSDIPDLADVGILIEPGANTPEAYQALIEEYPDCILATMIKSGKLTVDQVADPDARAVRARMRKFFESIYTRCPYEIDYADRKGCRACSVSRLRMFGCCSVAPAPAAG